jgi:predicted metal-dependent TIM-barrel fold hydrolase
LTYGIALSVKPEEQTLENATRILYEGETTIMLNAELTKNYLKLAAINAEMSSRGIDPLKDEGTSEDSRI